MPASKEDLERAARAARKVKREREAALAVRDYAAEQEAVVARTARLRALRLAKEAADASPAKTARPKKTTRRARST